MHGSLNGKPTNKSATGAGKGSPLGSTRWIVTFLLAVSIQLSSVHSAVYELPDISNTIISDPSNNSADQDQCAHHRSFILPGRPYLPRMAFLLTGGHSRYQETASKVDQSLTVHPLIDILPDQLPIHQLKMPDKVNFCVYTNEDSILCVSNCIMHQQSPKKTERGWINYLLGNFLMGDGPENIFFPHGSAPSSFMKNSLLVRKTLRQYFDQQPIPADSTWTAYPRFGLPELINTLRQPLSLRHFIGSAEIRINQRSDTTIQLTIINVTSITSSDITRHFRPERRWPASVPRSHQGQPLSNTCQVFQIILCNEEARSISGLP